MIEKELYLLLTQHPRMANIAVYPNRLAQGTTFPAINYSSVGGSPSRQQDGRLRHPRFHFNVWGTTYDEMLDAINKLMQTLDGYNSGTMSATYDGELDLDDPETNLFRRVIDFEMWEIA